MGKLCRDVQHAAAASGKAQSNVMRDSGYSPAVATRERAHVWRGSPRRFPELPLLRDSSPVVAEKPLTRERDGAAGRFNAAADALALDDGLHFTEAALGSHGAPRDRGPDPRNCPAKR